MRRILLAFLATALVGGEPVTVLKAARMFDARTGRIVSPGRILVRDGRIADGPEPADARVLDLGDRTLLPGFIDCHTHMMGRAGLGELEWLKETHGTAVIDGVRNARTLLDAGFTTVRDLGSHCGFGDLDLRDAINRDEVPGPRMLAAGEPLSITGGHGDTTGYPEEVHFDAVNLVDSPDAGVLKVRQWSKRGVDVIKIHATGGVLSNGDDPGAPSFSPAEFTAIVTEARRRGLDVAAHAHGDAGILEAVKAGVRSIEHGSLLSPATAAEMKAKGTFLVPTLYALESIVLPGNPLHVAPGSLAKARAILPLRKAGFKAALDAGVPIAYGTDIGVFDHKEVAADFRYLVAYGMTPAQALQSATLTAARLLRREDRLGTLEPGREADIIAVEGNPLEDIRTVEHVVFVMKGGAIFRK
jgi:imidazolonepropionase-like amidohydrolase